MSAPNLPPLPLEEWEPTRLYLQLLCQIVGKIRLKLHPPINHWWHVTLYVSPRGLTTGSIPYAGADFDIEIDLIDHKIVVRKADGRRGEMSINSKTIAVVYRELMQILSDFGIRVNILARPYECKSQLPFADDHEHSGYDENAVTHAFQILTFSEGVLKKFRSPFLGKCTPVQMFWHSFDLACTRFSGRAAPPMPDADPRTREAYTHEVNSAGFWFGDDTVPEPAYYCYTFPLPAGLADQPLRPQQAFWQPLRGSPTAILRYEDVRLAENPESLLLEFLQSSYEAGTNLAGWDRAALER
jgi:hypothetical protein